MPSREEITYFGAGPALLPTAVLESAAAALQNYQSTGLGLAEHSHRSPLANQILSDTKASLRSLLSIPDSYEILFMQGGGSGEFSAVVYNMVSVWVERRRRRAEKDLRAKTTSQSLRDDEVEKLILERLKKEVEEELWLDYLVTGSWSLKASQEAAKLLGPEHVNVALDARKANEGKFGQIPGEETWTLTPTPREGGKGPALVYYCDNETVDGVEFPSFPKCLEAHSQDEAEERLVVADMSSNILSRKVDVSKFSVIFAGAQKNIGLTGLTIVILRRSLLPPETPSPEAALLRSLNLPLGPVVFDYPTLAANNSLYNTLSIFDVWVAGQVMKSLLETYGAEKVGGMETVADKKAAMVYAVLNKWESKGVYRVVPGRDVRSRMNICFRVGDEGASEKDWLEGAEKRGLMGLKGHRSVGGIRVSNYNSVSIEGVEELTRYMEDYAQNFGTNS
ncbi:MAG: Phosphoserine transaminase [Sclerophora amabilis]|nr:MAG: Phosphoserine transaminase [Sclerophora amabilis]